MAAVLGLGGLFFKAKDPKASNDWYARVLGVKVETWGGIKFEPQSKGSNTLCAFAADSSYFEPGSQPFMINLIVDDIDALLARAAGEGVEPLGREDGDPHGRFAWLLDPNGIKLELWQPAASGA